MENDRQAVERLVKALRESEERYRSVTQTSIDAIITTNDQDRILTWNHGAELMFGHGREALGRPVTMIIPEKYRDGHRAGMARYLETGQTKLIGRRAELEGLRKDGSVFPLELSLSTWESEGRTYFGAVIRDISERRRLEKLREDVARMIRHDLKSPLIGITGLAGLIAKGGGLTEKQRFAAEKIEALGQKMLNLIGRSRDIFQMEEGSYRLVPENVDLTPLVREVVDELKPLIKKNRTSVEIIPDDSEQQEKKYSIQGDAELLELLFSNLIKNAIEATPPSSPVRVSFFKTVSTVEVEIHNQGVIPEEIREKFFEAYTTSGKRDGSGLGTHSAQLVTRTHQGEISFTTSEEDGTTIRVSLPIEQA